MSEHEEAETDLRSSSHHVWRASVALLGIYVFFNAERLLGIITSIKRDKKKQKNNRRVSNLFNSSDVDRQRWNLCVQTSVVPWPKKINQDQSFWCGNSVLINLGFNLDFNLEYFVTINGDVPLGRAARELLKCNLPIL